MFKAVIRPEFVNTIDPEAFLGFNSKHGQQFLDMVGFRKLGGISLSVYGDKLYTAKEQAQDWHNIISLDLSCGAPVAVVGMPFECDDATDLLTPFLRLTRESIDTSKIILPLSGVEIVDRSEALV